MLQEGIFKCPKCSEEAPEPFKKWQKKNNKWIFCNDADDWGDIRRIGDDRDDIIIPEECWSNFGGSTEEVWNKSWDYKWECEHCHYKTNTFTAFIPNYK